MAGLFPKRNDRFIPVIMLIHKREWLEKPILTPACRDMDQAEQVRKDINRAARYYCSCGDRFCTRNHDNIGGCPNQGMRLSCRADIVRHKDGTLRVQVTLRDKRIGIQHVIRTYGPDPANWPYHAKRKQLRSE